MEKNNVQPENLSFGIPGVVIGVLIALKHIGMTSLSYWSIIWFGIKVWLACAAIIICLLVIAWIIGALIEAFIEAFK